MFGGAAVLALVCTPLALRLARRFDFYDVPGGGKSHETPVPYLGGLAIVVSFVPVVVVAELAVSSGHRDQLNLAVCMAIAVALAVLGLVDDRRRLSPWPRLALEIGAGVAVWTVTSGTWLPGPQPFQAVATVCWVVILTNAFNLLDNMDGSAAGIAAISSIFLFAVALRNGQFLLGAIALALAGSAVGFLPYNFHPARIYMGDSGSLFLGFLLAVLTLNLRFPTTSKPTILVPLLLVGLALFDTTLVTITRLLHGRSPLQGGLDHVSHRLVFVGLSTRGAVFLLYATSVVLGSIGLVVTAVGRSEGLALCTLAGLAVLAAGLVLAFVPVYQKNAKVETLAPEAPVRGRHQEAGTHRRQLTAGHNASGYRPRSNDVPAFEDTRRWSAMGRSRGST